MANNTLELFRPLAEFGEELRRECPKNDCCCYLFVYEQYLLFKDEYRRISEAIPDLSETVAREIEHAIRKRIIELHELWRGNYAVQKHREKLEQTD